MDKRHDSGWERLRGNCKRFRSSIVRIDITYKHANLILISFINYPPVLGYNTAVVVLLHGSGKDEFMVLELPGKLRELPKCKQLQMNSSYTLYFCKHLSLDY